MSSANDNVPENAGGPANAAPRLPPPNSTKDRSHTVFLALIIAGVFFVLVIVIGAGLVLPMLARSREAARRAACQGNLKQFALACKIYAEDSEGQWPPLSVNERFALDWAVYPQILTDPQILVCPSNPRGFSAAPLAGPTNDSYVYLGFAFTNEDEFSAFVELMDGSYIPADGDVPAPAGKGTAGGDVFYRLREGIEVEIAKHLGVPAHTVQADIPVAMERLPYHIPIGVNVLYMDGHVEFHKMPGVFPATVKTLNLINGLPPSTTLDRLFFQP